MFGANEHELPIAFFQRSQLLYCDKSDDDARSKGNAWAGALLAEDEVLLFGKYKDHATYCHATFQDVT